MFQSIILPALHVNCVNGVSAQKNTLLGANLDSQVGLWWETDYLLKSTHSPKGMGFLL